MNKAFPLVTLLSSSMFAWGQGTVNFANFLSATTHVSTNSVWGGAATGQTFGSIGSYYYALFVADSTITSAGTPNEFGALDPLQTPGWVFTDAYATNTASPGRFSGNPTTDDVGISGRTNGSFASFVVVGWSSSVAGPDWPAAEAWIHAAMMGSQPSEGWIGASSVATSVQLGGGIRQPGVIFGPSPGQVQGFVVQVQAPEPSVFALSGIGAAALMLFRGRRRRG